METETSIMETSCLYYVTGYYGKPVCAADGTANGLLLMPLVTTSPAGCVEMLFIAAKERSESDWDAWFREQGIANHFFTQLSSLVKAGSHGEACADRLINTIMVGAVTMSSDVFDAYRIASDGKMHFLDGREWVMTRQAYDVMVHEAICIQARIQMAWQRRFNIENELDMARDVLTIAERLDSFRTTMVLESGAPIYAMSNNRMLLQFMPLFDWDDVEILENEILEMLTDIDELTRQQIRLSLVLDKQKILMGMPLVAERRKRHRFVLAHIIT